MRSVADDFRTATRHATADMTAEQRVDLALQLGDDDLKSFATTNGLSVCLESLLR